MRGRLTPSGARLRVDGIQEEISKCMDGNLCRCGIYDGIVEPSEQARDAAV
jgi:aerobic-type carbon monoxide dehydrogenase small subunit (CoxS/CutS family)